MTKLVKNMMTNIREIYLEFFKIKFPSKKEVITMALGVLVVLIVCAISFALIDACVGSIANYIIFQSINS